MIVLAIIWLVFVLLNIGWAFLHAVLITNRIAAGDDRQIEHIEYGILYTLIMALSFLYVNKSGNVLLQFILYAVSLSLLHLSVFPIILNRLRGIPTFNLSHTSTSLIDRLMVRVGLKNTKAVNIAAFILSIILIFIV